MQPLYPVISFKAALAGFRELGLDTEALLAATGVAPEKLGDPFAAVPKEAFARLWAAAFGQQPDPTLPTRAGFAVPFSEFGVLDHLVESAGTVGESLLMLSRFLWLVSSHSALHFSHGPHDWLWVPDDPDEPSSFVVGQWRLALILQRFRRRVPAFAVEEVHLSQGRGTAGDAARFEALWGAPVRLEQAKSALRLADGVWGLANTNANPGLERALLGVAEQVEIKQFEEAPLVYALRTRLPGALERGAYSAEDVAAELGLSKRTLQRQLSSENVTFQDLLDEYRHEQAVLLLQNGERDLGRVAYALGYREQSSFNRAFRRWTDRSPSVWLQSIRD